MRKEEVTSEESTSIMRVSEQEKLERLHSFGSQESDWSIFPVLNRREKEENQTKVLSGQMPGSMKFERLIKQE